MNRPHTRARTQTHTHAHAHTIGVSLIGETLKRSLPALSVLLITIGILVNRPAPDDPAPVYPLDYSAFPSTR